ncbi:increased DNA methylation 2 [Prunus yedoensis var. nudiflora]|uniref:Increased DNA methylation 2 n=1 Tax=Prunus yedoensis var. nudiflora TaxID=2094558 RepID=A0A314Z2N1_PRUYE|nr:increased DNA methylation 2 [Prunus yedoensis var. nudiflora]
MAAVMDSSSQATQSNSVTGLDSNNVERRMANDDQRFLLYFIMGTYFGPGLKGESPPKSVLQRIAERLPPYTFKQLGGSHLKTAEVEQVYYYVLRKADKSAIVKLPVLYQFFHGNLLSHREDTTANYPQFPDLFPLHSTPIHKTHYIKTEDIERFKRLTGLEEFLLDRDAARLHTYPDGSVLYNVSVQEPESNGESPPTSSCQTSRGTKHLDNVVESKDPLKHVHVVAPISSVPYNGSPMLYSYMAPLSTKDDSDPVEKVDPAMIFLPSLPTKREWSNIVAATRDGFGLTGSAAKRQVGPTIGLIDIGECEDSYLFRVSLPGVRRDEREFSCEVENEGRVLIRGVTMTGEKTLPGPVDPQEFSGNFGTDGILEGVVMKRKDAKYA